MTHKNRILPDTWRWGIHLIIGVLFMVGIVFFSSWRALRATEERFCQTLDFVKSQSTSFEKYNDTVVAKALRRAAVAVHQLAKDPALDFSDPQCLNKQVETLWLTGISVLAPDGTLLCESTTNGIGYARFGEQLKNDTVLDVFSYLQKTYLKRVLLEDGSAVDVAAYRAEDNDVILLAYRYTPAKFVEGTALSIQSVLDGYSAETSGTLFIVQNNQVIASNRPELIGQGAADSPLVQGIRKTGTAETLTHTHDWNGSGCYFGMYCHGRSFDLYAYTDEKSVFRESLPSILMALVSYILLVMILQVLRRRSVQEMEQQKKEQERKYQAQLEEQNRKLEIALQHEGAANRAKREFLFNMSHDIRTPMNAIIGFTSLAATHIDNKEQVLDYLKKISTSSQHLLSLINDILQMSKLESGEVILSHEIIDLNQLTRDILTIMEQRAAEAGITLRYEGGFECMEISRVYGSPLHLRQIFLNIYGNCIKYNKSCGRVETAVSCLGVADGRVTYRWVIRDTGIGMSKDFLQHIFTPFSQERSDSTRQGTGLGMAIVKSLIDEMQGTITIESEEGVGSVFTITLPFEIAAEQPQTEQPAPAKAKDISGLHLLLVEDNALNAEIAAALLADRGVSVELARDGSEAVRMFREAPAGTYAGIIMDIMMPVMDGLTATRAIRALERADAKTIPIIAMTANAFEEDARQCLAAGMNVHLAKPLCMEELVAILARLCA